MYDTVQYDKKTKNYCRPFVNHSTWSHSKRIRHRECSVTRSCPRSPIFPSPRRTTSVSSSSYGTPWSPCCREARCPCSLCVTSLTSCARTRPRSRISAPQPPTNSSSPLYSRIRRKPPAISSNSRSLEFRD